MSVEPEHALSAPTTARVIGVRPVKAFVAPIMSLRDDAKRCNTAMRRHNGAGSYTPNNGVTEALRAAQIKQRAEWFSMIQPQLMIAPMTLPALCAAWGMSKGAEVNRVRLLEAEGYVKRLEGMSRVFWGLK